MKKLLTTILSFALSLSMMLMVGCKDGSVNSAIFNGNYTKVLASELTAFSESVVQSEKGLDISRGVEFVYIENEVDDDDYEKEAVNFKTAMIEGVLKMKGNTSEEEKDDGRETSQISQVYYDGETMYVDNGVKKVSFKTTISAQFERAMTRLNEYTLDKVIAKYSAINGVEFFKEETAEFTKIKLEFENIEDHDEKTTGKILFTYNAQNELIAINVEIKESELGLFEDEYEEIIINIKGWEGAIEAPTDLDAYTPRV